MSMALSVERCQSHRSEAQRYKSNFNAALSEVKKYKTKDSLNAASVEILNLRVSEFEKSFTELAQHANNLELQNRRLLSASRTATVTEYKIITAWRDSIVIVNNQRVDTIKCVSYSDKFLTFSLCDTSDSTATPYIKSRDEMFQFVHRVPRFQWWFIRFGTKGIRQDITFANPNTNIEYTEFINFVK